MYFYVDESGQTGISLFDENQPVLYYGVLRCKVNLDLLAEKYVLGMRAKLGVDRLHANHLGNGELVKIVNDIETLRKKFDIRFDLYRVVKKDHALISFFDQVFDQGMNPAVPWSSYWTPLRYVLLIKLSYIFQLADLKKAWEARMTINNKKAEELLVEVCESILPRVACIPDSRSREIIGDAIRWASKNPSEISYNVDSKEARKQISPNLIGFQSVMHGMALQLKKGKCRAKKIVVDRQSEFNESQRWVADFYNQGRDIEWVVGPGLPRMDLTHIPECAIECTPGDESFGLELVDIYLWIFKRVLEGKQVAPELGVLFNSQLKRGYFDEVSLNAIEHRWTPMFANMPNPELKDLERARAFKEIEENKRKAHVIK